jgi:hypothetical protein
MAKEPFITTDDCRHSARERSQGAKQNKAARVCFRIVVLTGLWILAAKILHTAINRLEGDRGHWDDSNDGYWF